MHRMGKSLAVICTSRAKMLGLGADRLRADELSMGMLNVSGPFLQGGGIRVVVAP